MTTETPESWYNKLMGNLFFFPKFGEREHVYLKSFEFNEDDGFLAVLICDLHDRIQDNWSILRVTRKSKLVCRRPYFNDYSQYDPQARETIKMVAQLFRDKFPGKEFLRT